MRKKQSVKKDNGGTKRLTITCFFKCEYAPYALSMTSKTNIAALLSNRELEIIRLITLEYNNQDIAKHLDISKRTVETHRKNIFKKTKVKSVVGLVVLALKNGLVP